MWTQRFGDAQCVSKAPCPKFRARMVDPKPCPPEGPGEGRTLGGNVLSICFARGAPSAKNHLHTQHATFHDKTPMLQGPHMTGLLRTQLQNPLLKVEWGSVSTSMRLYLISQIACSH